MKKTIFTVAVPMQDQTQCDRMKAVCLENGLSIGNHSQDFEFIVRQNETNTFRFSNNYGFGIWWLDKNTTQVTEAEFLELLNEYKLNK
jgi:hypothetical protein